MENLEPGMEPEVSFLEANLTWILLIAAAVLVGCLILCLLYVRRKRRGTGPKRGAKRKGSAEAEIEDDEPVTILLEENRFQGISLHLVLNRREDRQVLLVDQLTVGRDPSCDVVIGDEGMSRRHFLLEWDGESVYIDNLSTTNGTGLNGTPLRHKRRMESGDTVKAGNTEIIIRWRN